MKLWKEIQKKRYSILRIATFNVILVCIFFLIHWDEGRLNNDFGQTMKLLRYARTTAIRDDKSMIVRFYGKKITAEDQNQTIKGSILVPTLYRVHYNTVMGDNMIVFDGHGTDQYNKRIHGGELNFESWFGFKKNIHVNCTGLAIEGQYPPEDQS